MKSAIEDVWTHQPKGEDRTLRIRLTWKCQAELWRGSDPRPEIAELGEFVYQDRWIHEATVNDASVDILTYAVEGMLHSIGVMIKEEFRQRYAARIADRIRYMRLDWAAKRGQR